LKLFYFVKHPRKKNRRAGRGATSVSPSLEGENKAEVPGSGIETKPCARQEGFWGVSKSQQISLDNSPTLQNPLKKSHTLAMTIPPKEKKKKKKKWRREEEGGGIGIVGEGMASKLPLNINEMRVPGRKL